MVKAEKERAREKRRTLTMLEKLEIDKVKVPHEMVAVEAQMQDVGAKEVNSEMLDSLPSLD